ncbi:hypothetical protein [Dongia sedimenti]|uniref:Uncharacterized protein n=1 Tax=Dongia sedimenti TaxID=3064282 RepID=A0ABU0YFZ4_9PROT|nr:hypothetical protein [Rhodospirillaceae bacterium R-7]
MERRKIICDKIHGVLDYGVVIIFAAAPSEIGIVGMSAVLCYALAATQLAMTLFSDMPLAARKLIPMRVHGFIEIAVSLALIAVGWIFPGLFASGQLFFTLMGAIVFCVWISSDFSDQQFAARA